MKTLGSVAEISSARVAVVSAELYAHVIRFLRNLRENPEA